MDFNAAEAFLSKFYIRDLYSHRNVPFIFKKNQKKLQAAAIRQQEAGLPIRIIVDKARRTGCSSWSDGILFAHCLSLPNAHALIAAHEFKSSKAIFGVPKSLRASAIN